MVALRAVSRGVPVSAATMTQIATLTPDAHIDEAVQTLLRTSQSEFPVVDAARRPVGLLGRGDIIRALKELGPDARVSQAMTRQGAGGRARPHPRRCGEAVAGKVDARGRRGRSDGRLVGIITSETIGELLMVREAMPASVCGRDQPAAKSRPLGPAGGNVNSDARVPDSTNSCALVSARHLIGRHRPPRFDGGGLLPVRLRQFSSTTSLSRRRFLKSAAAASAATLLMHRTLSEPRRRPPAHHPRRAIGRRLDQFRHGVGARRPARRACWSRRRPPKASTTLSMRHFSTCCRKAISPASSCSTTCRPARTSSTACDSRICRSRRLSASRWSGAFARRRPTGAMSRSYGRAIPAARAGASTKTRGGLRTYATMLDNRPDFFIHSGDSIYADCTIPTELKLPDGGIWKISSPRTRADSGDACPVPWQLQIQSARRQSARVQRTGPDLCAMGRPRSHQ